MEFVTPESMDSINNQISLNLQKLNYPRPLVHRQMVLSMSRDQEGLKKLKAEVIKQVESLKK